VPASKIRQPREPSPIPVVAAPSCLSEAALRCQIAFFTFPAKENDALACR
jgi:hypothetical protein